MGKYKKIEYVVTGKSKIELIKIVNGDTVNARCDSPRWCFGRKTKRSKWEIAHLLGCEKFVDTCCEVPISKLTKSSLLFIGYLEAKVTFVRSALTENFERDFADKINSLKKMGIYHTSTDIGILKGTYHFQYLNDTFALTEKGWVQKYRNHNANYPSPINSRVEENGRSIYVLYVEPDGTPNYNVMLDRMVSHINTLKKRNKKSDNR